MRVSSFDDPRGAKSARSRSVLAGTPAAARHRLPAPTAVLRRPRRGAPGASALRWRSWRSPERRGPRPDPSSGRIQPRMSTLTEGAVFDALRTVQEPELGRDIVTLNMVKGIAIDGARVAFTIELTTPACPLKDEIERNARAALAGIGVVRRRDHLGRHGPPRGAVGRPAAPRRREEHHRRRLRQGRRGEEHRQREPRRRAGADGRGGGPARRRHHGSQHPADDGARGRPEGRRRQQDPPARALRREGDLDRLLRARRPADRLARAAGRRGDPAVPARRRLGRARLPRRRPAARDLRRPADAGPGRPDLGVGARDAPPSRSPSPTWRRRWRCSSA